MRCNRPAHATERSQNGAETGDETGRQREAFRRQETRRQRL